MLTIGIIREGKNPPDHRVVLSPAQCKYLIDTFPLKIKVQPSRNRCFSDAEYEKEGISLSSDVSDCDLLIGIKEVPVEDLMAEKRYLFFSHTIKKQPSNKKLLQAICRQNIELIDFELITDDNNQRLIAFGEFAGMVGAHNALLTWGRRTNQFSLPRMYKLKDYQEAVDFYKQILWPPVKIVLTGTGRVGQGAASVLMDMGIRKTDVVTFLSQSFDEPVFVQLKSEDYLLRKDGSKFNREHFHLFPSEYSANFTPFIEKSDILINGIYWNFGAPEFFTKEEMMKDTFRIKVIADLTCDIAPVSSVPSTLRASSIEEPIYSYIPETNRESYPTDEKGVDVMAIDNLPNELPRDASLAFGEKFILGVLPDLLIGNTPKIEKATIARKGSLMPSFSYLEDYIKD
ncbi:MAG: NAD(P)-dependent oxidoreductase [Haliscomenobacter sp.]|nr:NAD(P)-dependent oxidoreductase [Haliscomenobacter sp.]